MRSHAELRILFIDDDKEVLQGIQRIVGRRHPGWKIYTVSDPIDGMTVISTYSDKIDAVVCDIHMPYISGVKILKILQLKYPGIARITLSGMLDSASIRGSDLFSECHICKPVHVDHLCDKIIATYAGKQPGSAIAP